MKGFMCRAVELGCSRGRRHHIQDRCEMVLGGRFQVRDLVNTVCPFLGLL